MSYIHIYHPPPPPANSKRDDQSLTALFHWWKMRLEYLMRDAPGPVGDPWLTGGLQEILCLSATEIRERMERTNICQDIRHLPV